MKRGAALLGVLLAVACRSTEAPGPRAAPRPWEVAGQPSWIWAAEAPDGPLWFRHTFELRQAPARAELWVTCDNRFELWLNGQPVASGEQWEHPARVEVTEALRVGDNRLAVRGRNDGGPAGLILELDIEQRDGSRLLVDSGPAFLVRAEDEPRAGAALERWLAEDQGWSAAAVLGPQHSEPWWPVVTAEPAPVEPALAATAIQVPEGFRVERLYEVPLESQGSWVALTPDAQGRLIASDQYGGLYRIAVDRRPVAVERLAVELGEAQGLLWAFDALYAVVNGSEHLESGLYRARDGDGDGELDTVECLTHFEGNGEHGPHALLLHPDGRSLVVVGGNHTRLPGPIERSRLPATWAEDALLPPLSDPGGHAVGIRAPGGWIVRTDPDGRHRELVAAGLRNSYDAAFDDAGELFTYEADMEWDVGLPWYRPTRILHVVSGADFGWRTGSAKWPADVYDSLPAAVDVGPGSPTGVVFGSATDFPAPWRTALFACDWAYGRLWAVSLEPEGASFRGRCELFASGQPFPVTDVVVGADRALYVTTGGRRTSSALYRIAWTGAVSAPAPRATPTAAGRLRQLLEEAHGVRSPEIVPIALRALEHEDRFVRHAARVALEAQDPESWRAAALAAATPRARLEGLLACLHACPPDPGDTLARPALEILSATSDPLLRLDALRLIELTLARLALGDGLRAELRGALDPLYPSGNERLDRALLPLLVRLGAPPFSRALAGLERAVSQEQRIAILYALRAAGQPPPGIAERLLEAFATELERARGGNSVRGYLQRLRDEVLEKSGLELTRKEAAEPILAAAVLGRRTPARPWAWSELEAALGALDQGSPERGRSLYAASCAACHRLDGEGENRGPDLGGAAGRYSPSDLLRAILEPSREVPDVWRDTELWGQDRLLAVGRIEAEEPDRIVVRESSGKIVSVPRELLTERRLHPLSAMPEGLIDALDREQVLDLLAYVLGRR